MYFNRNIKMADVILHNHHLLSVISRFDIELGFGEQTVEEVCRRHQVDVDFFLEIVNAFNEPDYFPDNHLAGFSLNLIISYLKKTHQYYLQTKIPEISEMINRLLAESQAPGNKELSLISRFFDDYHRQLMEHIDREENVVYPYILRLETFYKNPGSLTPAELKDLKAYAIQRYEEEHESIEESLYDLKSLIIKYLPPQKNRVLCYKILGQLGHLEADINDHSNMEDRVLVPRVKIMEKALNK